MKMFYVTAAKVHGIYELGTKKDILKKYRDERGLRILEVDGMPVKFWRNDDFCVSFGKNSKEAEIRYRYSLGGDIDDESKFYVMLSCPRLERHVFGVEVWTSEGKIALFNDWRTLVRFIEEMLTAHNADKNKQHILCE